MGWPMQELQTRNETSSGSQHSALHRHDNSHLPNARRMLRLTQQDQGFSLARYGGDVMEGHG